MTCYLAHWQCGKLKNLFEVLYLRTLCKLVPHIISPRLAYRQQMLLPVSTKNVYSLRMFHYIVKLFLKWYKANCNLSNFWVNPMLMSSLQGWTCSVGSHTGFCSAYCLVLFASCMRIHSLLWVSLIMLTSACNISLAFVLLLVTIHEVLSISTDSVSVSYGPWGYYSQGCSGYKICTCIRLSAQGSYLTQLHHCSSIFYKLGSWC